jgi:hypothetical protein
MRRLYLGAAAEVAVVLVLLALGQLTFAVIVLVLLIPTVDYIRRQRRFGKS